MIIMIVYGRVEEKNYLVVKVILSQTSVFLERF